MEDVGLHNVAKKWQKITGDLNVVVCYVEEDRDYFILNSKYLRRGLWV